VAGAGVSLRLEHAAAARAVAAICRHAAAERDGAVSLSEESGELVLASPGETSLLVARFAVSGMDEALTGRYAPPQPPGGAAQDGPVTLRRQGARLRVTLGRTQLTLDQISPEPVAVEWIWPAQAAVVEAVVARDALLAALPPGEGRITFCGADKQLLLEAGRSERRLSIKNRPRRRNDLGTAVAFDQLRLLVEAAGADVTIGLADLRPLTIESGPVRGMLVRGTPMRWQPRTQPPRSQSEAAPARRRDTAASKKEAMRRQRELARQERRRQEAAAKAGDAIARALTLLDAAAGHLLELDSAAASSRLGDARAAVAEVAALLPARDD
jgi:hypothetical protein